MEITVTKKTKKNHLNVVPISQREKIKCSALGDIIEERIQQFIDDAPGGVTLAEIIGCLDLAKDRFK